MAAPNAQLTGRTTFRILRVPAPHNAPTLGANDPMLENSITYRALREELRHALEARGYRFQPDGADLDVAYYATAGPTLDVRTFDYGYTWRGFPRQYTEIEQYEQGTVIIDVVDPPTRELLWRGQAVARVDSDPAKYVSEIRRTVDAIVKKLPPARP